MKKITAFILFFTITILSSLMALNFNFTSSEGYSNGVLDGQNGWTSSSGVQVNATTGKLDLGKINNYARYTDSTFYGGYDYFSGSVKFSFNMTASTTINCFRLVDLYSPSLGNANVANIFFRYVSARGEYSLRYLADDDDPDTLGSAKPFFAADIGLDDDTISDDLVLTWKLAKGTRYDNYELVLNLYNETKGTSIILNHGGSNPTFIKKNARVSEEFYNSDNLVHAGMLSQSSGARLSVESFEMIPEASQISLFFGTAAFAYMLLRRRKK
jgi:hypothetical protein